MSITSVLKQLNLSRSKEDEAPSIDWLVRSQFDKVPIQIGDRRFTAAVDTGITSEAGVIIPYKAFRHLQKGCQIKSIKPLSIASVHGSPIAPAVFGKGSLLFYDANGTLRTFRMLVSSSPLYNREGSALLSLGFVARFDRFNFYGRPRMFEGVVYK